MRGAQKQERSGEPQNENDDNDNEMWDPNSGTLHTIVPRRMRKESSSTTATTAAFANRAYGFAIGESEHHQSGRRDDVDLADH